MSQILNDTKTDTEETEEIIRIDAQEGMKCHLRTLTEEEYDKELRDQYAEVLPIEFTDGKIICRICGKEILEDEMILTDTDFEKGVLYIVHMECAVKRAQEKYEEAKKEYDKKS